MLLSHLVHQVQHLSSVTVRIPSYSFLQGISYHLVLIIHQVFPGIVLRTAASCHSMKNCRKGKSQLDLGCQREKSFQIKICYLDLFHKVEILYLVLDWDRWCFHLVYNLPLLIFRHLKKNVNLFLVLPLGMLLGLL